MKRILCYGDSLTWGYIPGTLGKRYGADVRWPRQLARLLGDDFEVIEEALNGRTTVWGEPFRPGRDGAEMLQPLLESHGPLDLVILMLGSNDLLHYRDVLAVDVARGMTVLIDIIRRTITECQVKPPSILLISPPTGEKLTPDMALYSRGDQSKFSGLPQAFRDVAEVKSCSFLDGSAIVQPSEVADGIHLDETGNQKMAEEVAKKVQQILG